MAYFKRFFICTVLAFATFAPAWASIDSSLLIVTTKSGKLKGTTEGDVYVWKGIQYAKATSGDLRFLAPQPVEPWAGVKNATSFGPIAPQMNRVVHETQTQSEDCLYLNIWSPAPDGKKRPVMFWIHGGGFVTGSGSAGMYDGQYLAKNGDVVIVSINYRLGPFGFLYFKDLPGNKPGFENNLGIKDQIAALKWVKENIAAFGGDPEQVTIFGESAGAISVETLMAAPSAKGLFKRAIAESGPPQAIWTPKVATAITERFLKELNISPNDLSKLKTIPVDTMNEAMTRMMKVLIKEPSMNKLFAPTVDGELLPYDLMTAIDKGQSNGVDLLIGTNRNEANLFALKRLKMAPVTAEQLQPYTAHFKPDELKTLIAAYKSYPHKSGILELITDGLFTVPNIEFAASQAKYAPTYMYRFDWASVPLRMAGLKACHGLEIPFVFGTFKSGLGKKVLILANHKKIFKLSSNVQQSWLSFAKTGNPNYKGSDWKPYSATDRCTLIFDRKITCDQDPDAEHRKVWTGLNIFD